MDSLYIVLIVLLVVIAGLVLFGFKWLKKQPTMRQPQEKREPLEAKVEPEFTEIQPQEPQVSVKENKESEVKVNPTESLPEKPLVNEKECDQEHQSTDVSLDFENVGLIEFDKNQDGLPQVDSFIDEVFKIQFKNPIPGKLLVAELSAFREFNENSYIRFYAFDDNQKHWFVPDSIGVFSSVLIYLQPVTGKGQLDDLSVAKFYQILQQVELEFEGIMDGPDQMDVLERIKKLSRFIQEYGAQISLLIRSARKISIDEFEKVCSEVGFKRCDSKHYEKVGDLLVDEDGKRVGNRKGILACRYIDENNTVISLLVGLSLPEKDPLRELVIATNAISAMLDGEIFCGNGSEIDNAMFSTVRSEMKVFYDSMRKAGVEPGSLTAHRLLD